MTNKIYITSDLALSAFLMMNGLQLISAKKLPSGKFNFELEDPNDDAEELSVKFIKSDFCKFDNQIRTLKKLIHNR